MYTSSRDGAYCEVMDDLANGEGGGLSFSLTCPNGKAKYENKSPEPG